MEKSDKEEILAAIAKNAADVQQKFENHTAEVQQQIEKLATATAAGFAEVEKKFESIEDKFDKRFDQLDAKIENRTDLLEGMMRTDMAKDRDRVQMLEVRVTKLETAATPA